MAIKRGKKAVIRQFSRTIENFRPFSVGHGGHAKACECMECLDARRREFEALLLRQNFTVEYLANALHQKKFVLVKAHLRRQPNFLKGRPRTKVVVTTLLKKWSMP